jgi:ketosteroid isomerase-like protein
MTVSTINEVSIHEEIARLEAMRCRALVEPDFDLLDQLVSDDVVHVHATGHADDKRSYLGMVQDKIRFLSVTRERLDVRVYDALAVATGPLRQSIELRATGERIEMHVMTTQVWRQQGGYWRQVSFQATNL